MNTIQKLQNRPILFEKSVTTYAEQVAKLRQRGMIINNSEEAEHYLKHINYYRLRGYWLYFEVDRDLHTFRKGITFRDVLDLYCFDRSLRLLILDAIERIEVSVRSQWAYHVAYYHGSHGYLASDLAFDQESWKANIDSLKKQAMQSKEAFIQHFKETYSEQLPPAWAVSEIMSFSLLSRLYSNLGPSHTRAAIASMYGLDFATLKSWLHHLTFVRNICAHHSRLWNRKFTVTPVLREHKPPSLSGEFQMGSRKLYNTLVIVLYLMDIIAPLHHLRIKLKDLIIQYRILISAMDFPQNWQKNKIWQSL